MRQLQRIHATSVFVFFLCAMAADARFAAAGPAPGGEPPRVASEFITDKEPGFALMLGGPRTIMSGSSDDLERIDKLRKDGEKLYWFRRGQREYLIRDAGVLRELELAWKSAIALGEELGKLGERRGQMGGRHGARQGRLGAQISAAADKLGLLGSKLGALARREAMETSNDKERTQLRQQRRTIERKMAQLEREMADLDAEIEATVSPQEEEEIADLDRAMTALERRHDAAAKQATAAMNRAVDRAMARGMATQLR